MSETHSAFDAELLEATSQFDAKLDADVAMLLKQSQPVMTVAVAESLTGGLISERLTRIPGSSAYFLGGIVCYNPLIKIKLCGVSSASIGRFGVVSPEVAQEMAKGVQTLMKSDVSLSITGHAGPEGSELPQDTVGTVFVGVRIGSSFEKTQALHFSGSRAEIKEKAAQGALVLLRQWLTTLNKQNKEGANR